TSTTAYGSPSTLIIIFRFNSFAPVNATRLSSDFGFQILDFGLPCCSSLKQDVREFNFRRSINP
ncbi:MAG TPA: hypothetical protein VE360_14655, partial [Pyrinomonadaceae bacterium]|nr:hypothetical protein [Pyrinomonadaceae bacterium]